MRTVRFLAALLTGIILFSSCNDDDDAILLSGDVKDVQFVDATSYTDWVYFSFEKGEVVEVVDHTTDLSWDIAFHRGDIRLNGGESGSGKGEAVNTNSTDWNLVMVAPESGYQKDKMGKITTAFTGSDIEETDASFSQVLSGWLTIDTSNPPPKYTYHNWVFVVKSATGKYVKLLVYDYKNERNNGAYISFKYQYNESGSDRFDLSND